MNRAGVAKTGQARGSRTQGRGATLAWVTSMTSRSERLAGSRAQNEAAVHAPSGRHQSRAHTAAAESSQQRESGAEGASRSRSWSPDGRACESNRQGSGWRSRLVERGTTEVRLMQRGQPADEQLVDAPFDLVFRSLRRVASPTTTTRQVPPSGSSRCSCEPRNGQKADRIWLVSLFHDAIFQTVRLHVFCLLSSFPT